ncbi:ATP synthase F0 subunit B [Candidatus Uhrbacteria bacterium CG_4_10_14_0_8_um_filter_58_22]|uniref:ATP synthase subunit b n=1 Tax=Candidatus Uhrbacteria bacterium CG_4_10_14_0_8_um_filter_58_22 TaxID=1975029 RepID=A0A2M7QAM6_9BACT|nr:MAG: ATP synthase F0 subunit B [Parcubacteria group bacterium CG1_02_58_44]PIY62599.1 MAG: ATP synthase F0 subunit B [Candidatus Uhrbacteria bacterium CG_4_10_14_0_8_um_filter_58_22]
MDPAEAQHVVEGVGVAATLGLNWKLFLAQLVNFGLVLLVVWRFVYRPLMKVMDERSGKIERGLKDAEESKALRELADIEKQKLIVEARRQAKEIMETTEADAKSRQEEVAVKTRTEVERIVTDGKRRLRDEQEAMLKEAKAEISGLVIAATEKILREKIDPKRDLKLIETAIRSAEDRA